MGYTVNIQCLPCLPVVMCLNEAIAIRTLDIDAGFRVGGDKPFYVCFSLPKKKRNDIDLNVGNLKKAICSHFVLCL